MPALIRLLLTFTVVYIASVCFSRNVFAQPVYQLPTPAGIIPTQVLGPYSPLPQTLHPSAPTPSGVSVSASTTVPVALPGGKTVPVPLTATAQVSRLAIAKAVAKLLPIASTALAIQELVELLAPIGYRWNANGTLEAPERSGVPGDPAGTAYIYKYFNPSDALFARYSGKTPAEACTKLTDDFRSPDWHAWIPVATVDAQLRCTVRLELKTCEPGSCWTQYPSVNLAVRKVDGYYSPTHAPLTEAAIEQDIIAKMADDSNAQKRLYDALQRDWERNPRLPATANPLNASTPVSINAPPASTPERIVSVQTRQLADGSTDTITTKERTTVTPATTGTTMGDISTTYNYQTTTTSSTTNNVTNITTTSTTVQNGEIASALNPSEQDPCIANPDRVECASLGTPPSSEALPRIDVPFSFSPLLFASSASCPAPIPFQAYGPRQISFEPLCNVMTQLRPLFLACASLATALIFLQGIRQL